MANCRNVVDVVFAWLVAGLRFNGAISWVWFESNILRHTVGACMYFFIIFILHTKAKP